MKRWRTKLALLGGAAALGLAIPAIGQEAPESLLPPGFGDPETLPPPVEQPPAPPPGTPVVPPEMPVVQSPTLPMSEDELEALEEELDLPEPIEIPDASRRPLDLVGPLGPPLWGLALGAFGPAHGPYLSSLPDYRLVGILFVRSCYSRCP